MSATQFSNRIHALRLKKNDAEWFPPWVFRYASSLKKSRSDPLVVSVSAVVNFLRSLRDNHKDVSTTMIYLHVMNKPGLAVRSPVDSLLQ
jgi:hypothetical protein